MNTRFFSNPDIDTRDLLLDKISKAKIRKHNKSMIENIVTVTALLGSLGYMIWGVNHLSNSSSAIVKNPSQSTDTSSNKEIIIYFSGIVSFVMSVLVAGSRAWLHYMNDVPVSEYKISSLMPQSFMTTLLAYAADQELNITADTSVDEVIEQLKSVEDVGFEAKEEVDEADETTPLLSKLV